MDVVEELVIKPFRDVVEKGKLAIENAGDSEQMLKEAQRLVKVGERGLTRIEASCKKRYGEYGNNFIIRLKENCEITEYRKQLTELLWDFEDYIEPDTFEAEKFHELQTLNREAAPKIYNILITMKLEVPNLDLSQFSPPSSPHQQTLSPIHINTHNPFGLISSTRGSMSGSQGDARSVAEFPNVEDATTQLRNMTSDTRLSSAQGHVIDVMSTAYGRDDAMAPSLELPLQTPPRPPSINPWDPQTAPCNHDEEIDNYGLVDRRPTVLRPESPVDPAISPMSPENHRRMASMSNQSCGSAAGLSDYSVDEQVDYRHSGSSSSIQSNPTYATSYGTRSQASTMSPTIPEEEIPRKLSKQTYPQPLQVRPPAPAIPRTASRSLPSNRVEDMGRQYDSMRQYQCLPPTAPLPTPPTRHDSLVANNRSLSSRSETSKPKSQTGLEVVPPKANAEIDREGLIPVETESSIEKPDVTWSEKDCTIGPSSSFYQYKGFCEGAKEVIRGDIGVKKTKKPGFSTATTVARCTGCLFELDFTQIEYDVNKEDKGNFHKSGINYRLRFLQKSHLPAKRVDDVLYACVFCVQSGRTLDECDATVFTNSKALFNHLTHHPRPLPKIPGIAVVEGENMPDNLRNDYDIQLKNPPAAHPAQLNLSQISQKATGVSRDQSRRLYGQRLLFDRSPALEICHGARLSGIDWPEKYNGEWIFAWHDGICASVPADIIKLNPPPSEDIRMVNSSFIRAKSRWKFQQKEKEKDKSFWLKFDKNESITNISYPNPEFWCWSGTNSKGKWGIFPKVFLEPNTIQELTAEGADRALTLTNEKNKSSSMLSKFQSKRRPSGRPPSIADSSSSHETMGGYYASRFSRGSK
ncbi:hypothetical protein QQS21_006958 [Conoideocrella luteorostrata]|uniref:SH3 domain-containing protein n=1 Tax=Conoideocrella luteorostrata TaxID=1105319 RepID=A0AAJ0FSX6_9HYPO|nr:hypothetical protein QQS21_006958 [Conoideocrella luteorostrata]